MNKKKRIIWIMESLKIGGAEKSLLTILELINKQEYDIDLLLLEQSGDLIPYIPKEVHLLKSPTNYNIFIKNRKLAPFRFLKRKDYTNSWYSLLWLINAFLSKIQRKKLYIGWEQVKHFFEPIDEEYDVAIAFLERKTVYYNIDFIHSKKKVGFIHNDYSKYPYDYQLDKHYFNYYHHIATVSDHCKEVLIDIFPEYQDKFITIKNMISKEFIKKLAQEKIEIAKEKNTTYICSVGRLVKQKGFDICIDVCDRLIHDYNLNIQWFIVGDGEERISLEKKIKDYYLEDYLKLVGSDINPYKWMNFSDIYVQPSRFEGYGITVAEAKALYKPIVASDIPEFRELLNRNNGVLAKDINDYVEAIKKLIENQSFKEDLMNALKNEKNITNELDKIYEIMEVSKNE